MKKWLKRIGWGLISLLLLTAIAIVVVLKLDKKKTSYLRIQNTSDSFVIKNVNLVPMTGDTILYRQDVLVENGFISVIFL